MTSERLSIDVGQTFRKHCFAFGFSLPNMLFCFHCILVHRNAGFMAFYFPSQHQFVAGKLSSEKNEYPGSQLNCSSVLLLELI